MLKKKQKAAKPLCLKKAESRKKQKAERSRSRNVFVVMGLGLIFAHVIEN